MSRFEEAPRAEALHSEKNESSDILRQQVENLHRDKPAEHQAQTSDFQRPEVEDKLARSVSEKSITDKIASLMRGSAQNQDEMREVLKRMLA